MSLRIVWAALALSFCAARVAPASWFPVSRTLRASADSGAFHHNPPDVVVGPEFTTRSHQAEVSDPTGFSRASVTSTLTPTGMSASFSNEAGGVPMAFRGAGASVALRFGVAAPQTWNFQYYTFSSRYSGNVDLLNADGALIARTFVQERSGSDPPVTTPLNLAPGTYTLYAWGGTRTVMGSGGGTGTFNVVAPPVPEPAGAAVLSVAGLTLINFRRRGGARRSPTRCRS